MGAEVKRDADSRSGPSVGTQVGRKWLRARKLRSRESLKKELDLAIGLGIRVLFERMHMRLSQLLLGP